MTVTDAPKGGEKTAIQSMSLDERQKDQYWHAIVAELRRRGLKV
jgi:hypothetical protein